MSSIGALVNQITLAISAKALNKRLLKPVIDSFEMSYADTQEDLGFSRASPDMRAIDYLRERTIILSEKTADRLTGDLKYQLMEGMKNAESITEIKQRLKPIFDGMKDYELERLARNEVMDSLNEGRMEAARDDEDVKYKVWQAALNDARTADDSKRLAGQIQPLDKSFVDPLNGKTCDHPPNRPNCRCNTVFLEELPDNVVYRGKLMYHPSYMYGGEGVRGESKKEPEKEKEIVHEKITKTVTDYEEKIKNQSYESCGAVDRNGDLIFTKDGEKDRVVFTKAERDKCKGMVFTHNHPVGCSFSEDDISFACAAEVKEMRVITTPAHGKSYSMKRKDGENLSKELWDTKIKRSFNKYDYAVHDWFAYEIDDGRMSITDANSRHHNEVWKRVAKDVSELEYTGD